MFKKIIVALLLIFAISISTASATEKTIENFLQNRLYLGKNFPQNSTENISKISENSLLQKIAITKKEFSIENFVLSAKISLQNFRTEPYIFITQPDGNVMKFAFPSLDADKNISFQIPLFQEGEYQIEILDDRGFPILNEKISFGKIPETSLKNFSNVEEIFSDINQVRKDFGYQKLEYSPLLQKIAIRKIADMQDKNYIGHKNLDGENIFAFVLADEKKYFKRLWENVSGGQDSSLADAYKWILDSPAHRYLLLLPAWKKVWMHYAEEDGKWFFVQVFSD